MYLSTARVSVPKHGVISPLIIKIFSLGWLGRIERTNTFRYDLLNPFHHSLVGVASWLGSRTENGFRCFNTGQLPVRDDAGAHVLVHFINPSFGMIEKTLDKTLAASGWISLVFLFSGLCRLEEDVF